MCHTCRTKLDRIAEIETECVELRDRVARTLTIETEPSAIHLPEKFYGVGAGNMTIADSVEYQQFADATAAMLLALAEPLERCRKRGAIHYRRHAPVHCEHHLPETDPRHRGFAEISEVGFKASHDWWRTLKAFAQACYAAGVDDGRGLLAQLAAGTMTAGQVNDRAYELMTRRRAY